MIKGVGKRVDPENIPTIKKKRSFLSTITLKIIKSNNFLFSFVKEFIWLLPDLFFLRYFLI
jgi:hypothetical protein